MVDEALHPLPKGVNKEDDDEREDQGKHKRIAAAGAEKEGLEEKDDQDIERCENAGEEEVDRPPADEGADVQKIIFEDAEGEKIAGMKLKFPSG